MLFLSLRLGMFPLLLTVLNRDSRAPLLQSLFKTASVGNIPTLNSDSACLRTWALRGIKSTRSHGIDSEAVDCQQMVPHGASCVGFGLWV